MQRNVNVVVVCLVCLLEAAEAVLLMRWRRLLRACLDLVVKTSSV